MRKIKTMLHSDGTQKVEIPGAVGENCVEFTGELEKRLGTQIGDRELRLEYELDEYEIERVQDYERGA